MRSQPHRLLLCLMLLVVLLSACSPGDQAALVEVTATTPSGGQLFGGGALLEPGGSASIPAPWRSAWRWFYRGRHVDHFIAPSPGSADAKEPPLLFHSGALAMSLASLRSLHGLDQLSWDFAVVPSYEGRQTARIAPLSFVILKSTPNPDAAFQFYRYLLEEAPYRERLLGLPALQRDQAGAVDSLVEMWPLPDDLSWQTVLDSLAHPRLPSDAQHIPGYALVRERLAGFDALRQHAGLDLEFAIRALKADLSQLLDARTRLERSSAPLAVLGASAPVSKTLMLAPFGRRHNHRRRWHDARRHARSEHGPFLAP